MKKKIALFGCGNFAKNHIRELSKREEVEVRCFIDPSTEKAQALSQLYSGAPESKPQYFNSLETFLASGVEFDAAVIVSPPKTHYEIAAAIVKLGKPVYVEKPFTVTTEEAKELSWLSTEHNTEVVIGTNRGVFPAYRSGATALKEGKAGELQSISMYYRHNWEGATENSWRQNVSEPASGLLADHSPHYTHFLFTDLGFQPEKVRHMGTRYNDAGVDVDVCYSIQDTEGRNAYIIFDGSPSESERKEVIKIYGTEGIITIQFEGGLSNAFIEKEGKKEVLDTTQALHEIELLGIKDYKSHPALIHNFVGLVTGEIKENANPAQKGILPVEITELVEKSKGLGKENSLTKEELREISEILAQEGSLNEKALEKFLDRGTEMKVDRKISSEATQEFSGFGKPR